jgi:hypothetical protein
MKVFDRVLEFKRTDKRGHPLKDRAGRPLPVIQVEYDYGALQGLPVAEGSQVIVRGRLRGDRVRARQIKNITPMHGRPLPRNQHQVWGRVTEWNGPGHHQVGGQTPYTVEIWGFRLQLTGPDFQQLLTDDKGNRLPVLAAEIRATKISGPLRDGDHLEIRGKIVRGTIYGIQVVNHSASAALTIKGWRKGLRGIR